MNTVAVEALPRNIASKKRKPYLTPNEVAEMLMVSPTTIRQWASQGKLNSALTPGGHRRFLRADVERFSRQNNLTLPLRDNDVTRILIVDDDEEVGQLLTRLFTYSSSPVETMTATSGFEAGRLVHSFEPHVVLLDLMMPGVDGFEVCRDIKQNPATRAIRVVAMTGYYEDDNVAGILDAGAEVCLSKPFKLNALLRAIGID